MELKESFATSAGHWYRRDGTTAYTIVGKNGKERNTTLRDARTMDLVPSVTTVMRVAAAPGLERWKMQNLLLAAMTLPAIPGESVDDYAERVIADAKAQGDAARDLGTAIHGSLEKAYLGLPYDEDHRPHVEATMKAIEDAFGAQPWSAEKSFCSPLGYGGKVDLHCPTVVIDFKTSAFSPEDKKSGYDEHKMQLAAYAEGLGLAPGYRAANAFVSTTYPGHVVIYEWCPTSLEQGLLMFKHLLWHWQVKTGMEQKQ